MSNQVPEPVLVKEPHHEAEDGALGHQVLQPVQHIPVSKRFTKTPQGGDSEEQTNSAKFVLTSCDAPVKTCPSPLAPCLPPNGVVIG